MIAKWCGLVLVGILLLVPAAGAFSPALDIVVWSENDWTVAGDTRGSPILVGVTDGSASFSGAEVVLSCDKAGGSIVPAVVTTDKYGMATATFMPGTRSGNVTITATALNADSTVAAENTTVLKVDHGAPAAISYLDCPDEAHVGSEVEIVVGVIDEWGNPVDNAREGAVETVTLYVGSPADGAVFISGDRETDTISLPLGDDGRATATLRLGTIAGDAVVLVSPPGAIGVRYLTIRGVANGPPAILEFTSSPSSCPADGESVFLITYTLRDTYGNLCSDTPVRITTSLGEVATLRTNSYGSVQVSYGRKSTRGTVTVTATAVDAPVISVHDTLLFTSTEAQDLFLTACPPNMKSGDVDPSFTAEISAWVTDESGAAATMTDVPVTFTITEVNVHGFNQTVGPHFAGGSVSFVQNTGENGVAEVSFWPGTFTGEKDAIGTCTVTATATLNGTPATRSVDLSWRTYPAFPVSVSASPSALPVNNETDVTISLTGDGWVFSPAPADVVLCVSRAPTMLKGSPSSALDVAKEFATDFSGMMKPGIDRLGLVSYGCLEENVSRDIPLTGSFSEFTKKVNDLSTVGTGHGNGWDKKSGRDLGLALEAAVDELVANSTPGNNRVIVVILDDEYALGWNKEAWEGTAKQKAEQNNVKIFIVLVDMPKGHGNSNANDHRGLERKLQDMASHLGAKMLKIDGNNYNNYLGDLIPFVNAVKADPGSHAALNTTLDANLVQVWVRGEGDVGEGTFFAGEEVLDYRYLEGLSTRIITKNLSRTLSDTIVDDTDNWGDRVLHYKIGTMEFGQTWSATLRLNVSQAGTIGLFTDGESGITFNDTWGRTYSQTLPPLYLDVLSDDRANVFESSALSIPELTARANNATRKIAIDWSLEYAGAHPDTVKQQVLYQYSPDNIVWDGIWNRIGTVPPVGEEVSGSYATVMDPRGRMGWYKIRVYAWEDIEDGVDAWRTTSQAVRVVDGAGIKIKLV